MHRAAACVMPAEPICAQALLTNYLWDTSHLEKTCIRPALGESRSPRGPQSFTTMDVAPLLLFGLQLEVASPLIIDRTNTLPIGHCATHNHHFGTLGFPGLVDYAFPTLPAASASSQIRRGLPTFCIDDAFFFGKFCRGTIITVKRHPLDPEGINVEK